MAATVAVHWSLLAPQAYPKEHFYEDWKIGAIQFVTGVIPLGAGTFSSKQGDRMANLWMYAINRYLMAMAALDVPAYVKALAEKLELPYPKLEDWKAEKAAAAAEAKASQ